MTDNLPAIQGDNLPAISAIEIDQPGSFRGDARLYQLSAPVPYGWDYETDAPDGSTSYVIVSAVDAFGSGLETYIFPANAEGQVISWGEMPGSFQGDADHERAIENAGWVLT